MESSRNVAVILTPRSALATVGGGGTAWVEANGWEVDGPGAIETRLRLLALRGEWLEAEGRILQEQQEGENTSCAGSGRKNPANSFTAALASLEEAAELGDEVVSSPAYSVSRRGIPTGDAGYHSTSTAVIDAAGEAMLKLALLCETLATRKDGAFEGGSGSGGIARGREALAALSVKRYLSAMSAGWVIFVVFFHCRNCSEKIRAILPHWTHYTRLVLLLSGCGLILLLNLQPSNRNEVLTIM